MTGGIAELDPRDPAVLSEVRELLAVAEHADGFSAVSDQAMLAVAQGRRELFGLHDAGGALEAIGMLGIDPETGTGEVDLLVRPDSRGRGLGSQLLGELVSAQDRDPAELRAWAHGGNPAAERLLERNGFAPVRSLFRLSLDPARLPQAVDEARPLPTGFAARAFDPADPGQAEAWVRVNAAAFAGHPEQGAVTPEDFAALTAEPWFDAGDLILAFDTIAPGEPLAGYTWIKTVREAGSHGGTAVETELYVLGVDPAYAGRGLGAALLGETLRRMSAHRPGRITLYVDGDNENARALYDRAGFAVDQRSTQWLRRAR